MDSFNGYTTKFVGYESLTAETQLKVILKDGEAVDSCTEGDDVIVLIETTPFYAESSAAVNLYANAMWKAALFIKMTALLHR